LPSSDKNLPVYGKRAMPGFVAFFPAQQPGKRVGPPAKKLWCRRANFSNRADQKSFFQGWFERERKLKKRI
jgi:hypothetical protein